MGGIEYSKPNTTPTKLKAKEKLLKFYIKLDYKKARLLLVNINKLKNKRWIGPFVVKAAKLQPKLTLFVLKKFKDKAWAPKVTQIALNNLGFHPDDNYSDILKIISALPWSDKMLQQYLTKHLFIFSQNLDLFHKKSWAKQILKKMLREQEKEFYRLLKQTYIYPVVISVIEENLSYKSQDMLLSVLENKHFWEYEKELSSLLERNLTASIIIFGSIKKFKNESWAFDLLLKITPYVPKLAFKHIKDYKDKPWAMDILLEAQKYNNKLVFNVSDNFKNEDWAFDYLALAAKSMPLEALNNIDKFKEMDWAPKIAVIAVDNLQNYSTLGNIFNCSDRPWIRDFYAHVMTIDPTLAFQYLYILRHEKWVNDLISDFIIKNKKNINAYLDYLINFDCFNLVSKTYIEKNPIKIAKLCLRFSKIDDRRKSYLKEILNKHLEKLTNDEMVLHELLRKILKNPNFKEFKKNKYIKKIISIDPKGIFVVSSGKRKLNSSDFMYFEYAISVLKKKNIKPLNAIEPFFIDKMLRANKRFYRKLINIFAEVNPQFLIKEIRKTKNPQLILQKIDEKLSQIISGLGITNARSNRVMEKILKIKGFKNEKLNTMTQACMIHPFFFLDIAPIIKNKYPDALPGLRIIFRESLKPYQLVDPSLRKRLMQNHQIYDKEFMKEYDKKARYSKQIANALVGENKKSLKGNLNWYLKLLKAFKTNKKKFWKMYAETDSFIIAKKENAEKSILEKIKSYKEDIKNIDQKFLRDPALADILEVKLEWIESFIPEAYKIFNKYELLVKVTRNLWTKKLPINLPNVQNEVINIFTQIDHYSSVPIYKDRQIVYLAHNEKNKLGNYRFGKKAVIDAIRKQGGKFAEEDFLRAQNTRKALKIKKAKFLNFLGNTKGKITAILDGHGGRDAFYLSDGGLKGGNPIENENTIKITYKEIAKKLIERKKKFPNEKNKVILVFTSCYSHTMIRKIYNEAKKMGAPFIAIGSAEYDQYGYGDPRSKFGNTYFKKAQRLSKATKDKPTTFGDIFAADTYRSTDSNMSVFIPSATGAFQQIAEKQKQIVDQFNV